MHHRPIPFIRELCGHRTEEEIREAEDNFRRYLVLVREVCEDMEDGGEVDSADGPGHSGDTIHYQPN